MSWGCVYMSAYVACFVFRFEVKISVLSWSEAFLLRECVWVCTCLCVCVYNVCVCARASERARMLYVCLSVTLFCPFWSEVLVRWGRVCGCMCTCLRMWHVLFSGVRLQFMFFREVKRFCFEDAYECVCVCVCVYAICVCMCLCVCNLCVYVCVLVCAREWERAGKRARM